MNLADAQNNFGKYVLAIIVVLAAYSVVDAITPQYSQPLALVTLMGIVLFYFKKKDE